MTKRVRELPYWPPKASGTIRGSRNTISPGLVTIGIITRIRKDEVEFTVNFNRGLVRYSQMTRNAGDATKFAQLLKDNVGKTLLSLGEIEIPEAGSQPINLAKLAAVVKATSA
jgi:hypothetical protein